MEIELIHEFAELYFPFLKVFDVVAVKLFGFVLRTHELDSIWGSKDFFLAFWFRSEDLENAFKSNNKSFADLTVFGIMVKNTFRSKYEYDCLCIVRLQVVG